MVSQFDCTIMGAVCCSPFSEKKTLSLGIMMVLPMEARTVCKKCNIDDVIMFSQFIDIKYSIILLVIEVKGVCL